MNRSIRFAAIFALLLTVILMVNLTRIQVFSEERYAQNGLNKRQFFEMKFHSAWTDFHGRADLGTLGTGCGWFLPA